MTTAARHLASARRRLGLSVLTLAMGVPLAAQPAKLTGTFTVDGTTTTWKQVYVSRHADVDRPSQHFLVVLLADRPLGDADREPARLQELAMAGRVKAVRMLWHEGVDGITTTPFDRDVADSGSVTRGGAILDLTRYDEQELEAHFKSKMLGQRWHFNAYFKGKVAEGRPMKAEDMDAPRPTTFVPSSSDPASLKRQVGALGYEWTDEGFSQAVKDPNAEAVTLFLKGGMPPDTKDSQGLAVLMFASMYCQRNPAYGAIVDALLAAGANPNIVDDNNSTPLIWAAQSCDAAVVARLIKAGGNVNARAKGGATPLMMAEAMQRTEVAALLRKAGAKPWK